MISIVRNLIITAICIVTCFLNYCLLQIGFRFFIPITVLPVFCFFVFGYKIPASVVLAIGVLDDVMVNVPIGTFALLYSSIAYIISVFRQKNINSILFVYIFSGLYIVVNFLCFITFPAQ